MPVIVSPDLLTAFKSLAVIVFASEPSYDLVPKLKALGFFSDEGILDFQANTPLDAPFCHHSGWVLENNLAGLCEDPN